MKRLHTLIFVAAAAVVMSQGWSNVAAEPVRVEIENEYVRVVRRAGTSYISVASETRRDHLLVFLEDAEVQLGAANEGARSSIRKRGDAVWNDGKNLERIKPSNKRYEVLEIELKKRPNGVKVPAALDAINVTPGRYRILIDNELVRVVRAFIGARAKAGMHAHPPFLAIALTDSHQRLTSESGETRESKRKAGSVAFNPALKHAEESLSDEAIELILVELK